MLSITLIFKRYDSIDHILRNARISDIFPVFFEQLVQSLSVPVLDDGGFAEDHVLDLGDIRETDQYISGESESEDDDEKDECGEHPEYHFLFPVCLAVVRM